MTDTTPPAPVVSSAGYAVTQVDGRTPTALEDFAGQTDFVAQGPTGRHQVCGQGGDVHHGAVRFFEKDQHGTGKDVRVWTVSSAPDGSFVAAC